MNATTNPPTITLDLLRQFCSTDETRPNIMQPFLDGLWTCATDGRVLIRTKLDLGVKPSEFTPPPTVQIMGDIYIGAKPIEIPDDWRTMEILKEECKDCEGTGHCKKCRDCDGDGEKSCCECGVTATCRTCRGRGAIPDDTKSGPKCEECDGEGEYETMTRVQLNQEGLCVDLKYLRLIHKLPGMNLHWRFLNEPLLITFDGGDGALMPLRSR